jgi:predicted kinase
VQNEDFNAKFAHLYEAQLINQDIPHSTKTLITFCGVPGSGKSTLAKKLAEDLKAQYVSNDDIRTLLHKNGQTLKGIVIGQISRKVAEDILQNDLNKLVILDSSIDRTWPAFFETAEKAKVKTFVIRMNCDREELLRRLEKRGRNDIIDHKTYLDTFLAQFNICKANVVADMELEPDYDYNAALQRIKDMLLTA